jgi:hypothetical protein
MKIIKLGKITLAALACALPLALNAANPPQVGDSAPDFALKTLDDKTIHLSDLTAKSKVVLVELRGCRAMTVRSAPSRCMTTFTMLTSSGPPVSRF